MTVTSKPLTAPKAHQIDKATIALAALIIGLILWPIGARFSIDGLFWLGNAVLAFLRIPLELPAPPHWAWYCVLAPLPYLCSRVEWQAPLTRPTGQVRLAAPIVVVTWLIVAGYDLVTTFLGIGAPQQAEEGITVQIAASGVLSAVLAVVLTFGPEWLIRTAWRQLVKG